MFKKKRNVIIAIIIGVLGIWLSLDLFKQSNPNQLPGGFKEVATYRNENNTGPVQLVYIVSVKDSLVAEFETYGDLMPHFKYGNTKVYFFMENTPYPTSLNPGDRNFDSKYDPYCIAKYEKFAMGNSSLIRLK